MPHEETRKIIRVGKTSYAVILPRAWLRYYNLTDKNKVRVVSNGNVVIEPSRKKDKPDRTGARLRGKQNIKEGLK